MKRTLLLISLLLGGCQSTDVKTSCYTCQAYLTSSAPQTSEFCDEAAKDRYLTDMKVKSDVTFVTCRNK